MKALSFDSTSMKPADQAQKNLRFVYLIPHGLPYPFVADARREISRFPQLFFFFFFANLKSKIKCAVN